MGGEGPHAERVAAVSHHRHEVVDPALNVGLAYPQLDPWSSSSFRARRNGQRIFVPPIACRGYGDG
jgi:hypothetical protein